MFEAGHQRFRLQCHGHAGRGAERSSPADSMISLVRNKPPSLLLDYPPSAMCRLTLVLRPAQNHFVGLAVAENLDSTGLFEARTSIYYSGFDSIDCHAGDHFSGLRRIS
jgi:hypothetical protein